MFLEDNSIEFTIKEVEKDLKDVLRAKEVNTMCKLGNIEKVVMIRELEDGSLVGLNTFEDNYRSVKVDRAISGYRLKLLITDEIIVVKNIMSEFSESEKAYYKSIEDEFDLKVVLYADMIEDLNNSLVSSYMDYLIEYRKPFLDTFMEEDREIAIQTVRKDIECGKFLKKDLRSYFEYITVDLVLIAKATYDKDSLKELHEIIFNNKVGMSYITKYLYNQVLEETLENPPKDLKKILDIRKALLGLKAKTLVVEDKSGKTVKVENKHWGEHFNTVVGWDRVYTEDIKSIKFSGKVLYEDVTLK